MGSGKGAEKGLAARERSWPGFWVWPDEFDRLFRRAGHGNWPSQRLRRAGQWLPDMDIFERNGKTVVKADLPGLKREDIDVTLDGDMLVISGQRKEENEVKEEDYYCSERFSGSFSRAISVGEGFKADDIEATYSDGILEVALPRPEAPEKKAKRVSVK